MKKKLQRKCSVLLLALIGLTGYTQNSDKQKIITGLVTDAVGMPLPGVNVIIKNTRRGTQTDFDGEYALEASPGEIIVFSFLGMKSVEKTVGEDDAYDVVLEEDSGQLDEVVIVGYGSVQKRDLTGAVSTVGNKDLIARGTTSPMAAMQGQVAGVNITANSGLPGADFDINIRGVNSLSGGRPLFVVDGIMTDNINFLNPMDIARIDILKDASSTAIYGSRGSNGVVIVTTKSGEGLAGQTRFSYQGFIGIKQISNMPDFHDAEEGILWTQNRSISRALYQGDPIEDLGDYYHGFPSSGEDREFWENVFANENYFDWTGEILRPSIQTNHFISAAGGSDKVSFVVGAGYQGDNGNIDGQYFDKYNFKANVDANVNDHIKMGANINLAYSERELRSGTVMQQLFRTPNWAPAYDENGEVLNLPLRGISGNTSPLADMKNIFNDEDFYVLSNFYLQFLPFDWMSIKSTFSPNFRLNRHGEYWDPAQTKSGAGGQMSTSQDFSYIWDNHLRVSEDFGAHHIDYDFIYSMQMDRNEYLYGFGWDLPFNSKFYNVGSASSLNTASSFQKSSLMSFTNRLNYSFRDKYLITGTLRYDGSSKLAPGNKWTSFPSAAVAWRVSEEDFLKNTSAVNNLKFRLSYGYTGNNNISPYTTQFAVDNQTYYDWNGTMANGFRPSAIANKALTWERTREWNLGMDFGFFNNRISGEVNVYDRLSLNLLMSRKLAVPTGWGSMMDNVGSVSNKGIEVQLSTINIRTPDFSWETTFTFSKNKNAIVDLYGKKEDDVPNRWFIGEPVEVVYAMEYDGVWQRDELTEENMQELEGTAKVKDLNGDGVIDIDNDMRVLGSPLPDWIGGLQTTFRYKNWDLSANLYTKQGVFIFSPFHELYTDMNTKQILDIDYYMRENPVTGANYTNAYPQPSYAGQYYGEDAEDYGYPGFNKDASFVRLQNVNLGYTTNAAFLQRMGLQDLRLYVNAVNPYVWTEYEGFDPEWGSASMSSNANSFSIYQIGANITF